MIMNKKSMISIILLVVGFVVFLFCPSMKLLVLFNIVAILCFIGALVLNYLAKKEIVKNKEKGKGITVLVNIFSILLLALAIMSLIGGLVINRPDMNQSVCQTELVKDCVDQGKGISKCKYAKEIDIPCKTEILRDEQMK